jgi:hypothetical protein
MYFIPFHSWGGGSNVLSFVWCLGFGTFVTSAHAACPMPLQKAQPDRFAEV